MNKEVKMKLIDNSSFDLSLKQVRFDGLSIPDDFPDDSKIKIRTKDTYKIAKLTEKNVELEFKREKYFEPAGLFSAEIILTVSYKLKVSKSKDKEKSVEEDLKNYYSVLLAPAATRASIIITMLTDIDFRIPIVDPPYPLSEEDGY